MYRIGLDTRPTEEGFKAHRGRGTGRYVSEVISRLLSMTGDSGGQFEFVTVRGESLSPSPWEARVMQGLPFGRRTFESQILLPRKIAGLDVDLVHFFAHGDAPARGVVSQIVTVLDLIPLRFPDLYRAGRANWRFRLGRYLEYRAVRSAEGIIAISESTKKDVVELLGVHPDKIIVTPLAVGEEFSPRGLSGDSWREEMVGKRAEFGLPEERPLLLYVGGIDPRKNPLFLLRTFAEVLGNSPADARPLLAMAGSYEGDDQFPKVQSEICHLGIESDVRLLGFVPDASLPRLYQSANVVVFPSLYEGFGLPVLESMACGVPVVAGNNSSIPEVAGDTIPLFKDHDLISWTRGILDLLSNPEQQLGLGRRGVERARLFSWEQCAQSTLDAYNSFLAGFSGRRSAQVERTIPPANAVNL